MVTTHEYCIPSTAFFMFSYTLPCFFRGEATDLKLYHSFFLPLGILVDHLMLLESLYSLMSYYLEKKKNVPHRIKLKENSFTSVDIGWNLICAFCFSHKNGCLSLWTDGCPESLPSHKECMVIPGCLRPCLGQRRSTRIYI